MPFAFTRCHRDPHLNITFTEKFVLSEGFMVVYPEIQLGGKWSRGESETFIPGT